MSRWGIRTSDERPAAPKFRVNGTAQDRTMAIVFPVQTASVADRRRNAQNTYDDRRTLSRLSQMNGAQAGMTASCESPTNDARLDLALYAVGRRRKNAFLNQRLANGHSRRTVNFQHGYGRSAHRRQSHQQRAMPCKVFRPNLPPRIEQIGSLSCLRINARDVRPLATIALDTAQRQILQQCLAAMLLGNDVVDLKALGVIRLRRVTVLTQSPARSRTALSSALSIPRLSCR